MQIEKNFFILLLLSSIIFGIGLQITPGLEPDSIRYIAVAEKILTYGPWYPFALHSDPLESWATSIIPPFFEYIISGFLFLGFEKLTAGGIASLLFLALIPFPLFYLSNELCNRTIAYISVLFFSSMASTWFIGTWIYTETTYIFLSLTALFYCIKYLKYRFSEYLILCAFFCMLSCLTRWFGIILAISIGAVFFWRYIHYKNISKNVLLGFLTISLLPVSILLVKNFFIFRGNIYPSYIGYAGSFSNVFIIPLVSIVKDFAFPLLYIFPKLNSYGFQISRHIHYTQEAGRFLSFNFEYFDYFYMVFYFVLLVLFFLFIYGMAKLLINFKLFKEKLTAEKIFFILPIIVYIILYLLGMILLKIGPIFLKNVSVFTDLDTRYIIPLYPCLIILFFYMYYELVGSLPESKKARVKTYFFIFVVLFLVTQALASTVLLIQQRDGKLYSSEEGKNFTKSDSFIFLENKWNKSDPIFSNVPAYPMKYYLDSYFNENIYEIQGNFQLVPSNAQSYGNITEILNSTDERIILFVQTNNQDKIMDQISKKQENQMFVRCLKDENYELWVNKKFDNFCS